ncbi:UPF0149 family protein [Lysobacter solisilvae (ex Woo and Kim 2020)]|uniref:UPF0149 family protein n=1 Tax=Agrilutibacter terrestris TaxID=2865112 RepID=UPI001CEC541A|nr:UPF0149 family protein [Lysobacter terrestris]
MSSRNAPDLPAAAALDAEIRALALATTSAELHGSLCGWLAGGGATTPDWLGRVLADPALPAVAEGSALDELCKASAAQLADRSFEFELLLPDADAPLMERSGALFDWCRGFLGGFGLAAGAAPALSEDSQEALADLAKLAAAQPQDDGDEEDEEALVELEEFVRVAALLLHGDCVMAAQHRQRFN